MKSLGFVAFAMMVIIGCQQEAKKEHIIAKVGDAVLTEEQVRASIDTTYESYDAQARKYASAWITKEMLFQEAQKLEIDKTPEFQQQVANVQRDLAVQELLQKQVYLDTIPPPADSLRAYFEQYRNEFFVQEDMVKLNVTCFRTREKASSFSSKVTRGTTWDEAVAIISSDSSYAQEILSITKGKYYSPQTILFPELWKVAQTLRENDVSFPVRTSSGYFIIQMLKTVRSGAEPIYEIAEQEVRARYMQTREQVRYDALLGTLRKQYSVELVLPRLQATDSAKQALHE